jgi:hypothetical protein
MGEPYTTKRLLVLRKLTRAIADLLRGQMRDYLAALAPLLRPRAVFGDYVQGAAKEPVAGADKAFKELQTLYEAVATARPFNLPKELSHPLEMASSALETGAVEYAHVAKAGPDSKTILVTSPFQWVLSYAGFGPRRLKDLLGDKTRTGDGVQQFVLHTLVLHVVLGRQAGVAKVLEGLQFPVSSARRPEFGELPVACISSSIATVRPPDDVLIESTEISGTDAFEEVVNVEDIVQMRNPLRERLLELVKSHGEDLLPG